MHGTVKLNKQVTGQSTHCPFSFLKNPGINKCIHTQEKSRVSRLLTVVTSGKTTVERVQGAEEPAEFTPDPSILLRFYKHGSFW